ncbi:MAG: right-handed parallel beta-helix repeat-containing protein [Pirellulales bacterium]|jgi:alpha-N-arabinofuranosidase|nr:right-handed parallel beta-helix repeat-containing protein [Thermoguttaceae bacterium]MDD4786503.1 right-handed parallel beta-helix repeat-containing protein [Pirellulales bacterium]
MSQPNKRVLTACAALLLAPLAASHAAELHVATSGDDANAGTRAAPLRTIQRAADLAQPGDVITVHGGVYRERIAPPRGGQSEQKRIVYQAAPGEKVEIKGSEIVKNWSRVEGDTWKVTLSNSFFGQFNPYNDLIRGDWFNPRGRQHHTGAVYLNGQWLAEAATLDDLLKPAGDTPLWFAQVDNDNTTIWAQFPGVNPTEQQVEINVRQTVFYPAKPGVNYVTLRGFTLRHAATPWAPPTAEQVGLIGTHWSKGWIIEDNVISHSICSAVALGKYGDQWDNTSANTAEGYVKTIERALENGWNSENIGHHVVRNNTISHCEQAGIVGSLGAAFSLVTGNTIHDIHVRKLFSGAEMAGIKLHAAIDSTIHGNHIYRTCRGIWLDWMAQGARVSGNLLHDNSGEDLFVEVNHGPFLIDNNLFLSPTSLLDMSQGGAYAHNLLAGRIVSRPELRRETPYHPPHTTTVAGLRNIQGGDNRFYNNIFVGGGKPPAGTASQQAAGFGLWVYDDRQLPLQTGGNVYYSAARPYAKESPCLLQEGADPGLKLVQKGDGVSLHLAWGPALANAKTALVTTQLLGKARIPGLPYENPDGSPLKVDTDYFGKPRSEERPTAGPFENPAAGPIVLKVW